MTTATDRLDVILRLLDEGWRPAPRDTPRVLIDIEVAQEMECGRCDNASRPGLLLIPMEKGTRYRAVVRCGRCGFEEEF